MAEKSVTLKHIVRREGNQDFFFYDGALTAHNGLLTLPVSRPEWVMRAWRSGYVLNPETDERLNSWAEVEELMSGDAKSVKKDSAESAEETSEDSDAGRQPKAGNGVRSNKSTSSKSADTGGTRTDRSGSTDDGEAEAKVELASVPIDLA